jgi:DNA-binding SARP family transcriptional activator
MEFRILGPLEVSHDGHDVALGGAKQRALLALLLRQRNEVVPIDRLVEDLWAGQPPAGAAKTLQVHVSRLRRTLQSGADEEVLLTRGRGYVIVLGHDDLDLERFERLLDKGRRALAASDPGQASERLREGLALWRGPPLSDFTYEAWAQNDIARLEQLRLSALEERLEADLALGRHADVVAELESLVREHPVRERLRGQLMLALYRAGRQADALEVYRVGRSVLVEELGIEPGPALRELQQAILEQDSTLDPPDVVPVAAAPGEASPAQEPTEERKLVTVLFAELRGEEAVEHDPERLRDLITRVQAVIGEELGAAGGRVDWVLGDGLLATFGAPVGQEDHAERALHAASAARERLSTEFEDVVSLRIGVESGEVLTESSDGQAPTGQPVLAARRLARDAAQGDISVGSRAAKAVKGAFGLREGKGAFRLERSLALVRNRGVPGLRRAFVGRDSELEVLQATHERVASAHQPHWTTIVGDAGVGKTSLVRALRDRLAPDRGRWYLGRCLAYGRAITYHPLAEILKERLGVLPSDPPDAVRTRLRGRAILGLTVGLEPIDPLHPHEARERLYEAWIELFDEIASEGPAVVVIEDLHWAEPPLLELLAQAARDVQGPVLLLTTARPEYLDRDSDWDVAQRNVSRLWLEPLSRACSEHMLDELAGDLPVAIRALILRRAEGNPFYAEEVLGSLLDQGVLRHEEGRWVASEGVPGIEIADSVQAVIGARIDLLTPADKNALQAAAVIGRSFWPGAVQALINAPDLDLQVLEGRDFVRRAPHSSLEGEREYLFKHALTRDVAYGSLPAARKARAHADFAEWLEHTSDGDDEHAPLLAHHFAEAVDPEHADLAWAEDEARAAELQARAVRWLTRAAELAFGRYELADAATLYRRAVALEDDAAARSALWASAAHASKLHFDMDGFREAMQQAIGLRPPQPARAQLYAELSREGCRPYMWKHPPTRDAVEYWVDQALALAPAGSEARAMAVGARAHMDPYGRVALAEEAVRLAEQQGKPGLLADAYETQAKVATAYGRLEDAAGWADRKLDLLPRLRDPDKRSAQCVIACVVYLRQGRIPDGLRAAAMHAEITTRLTPHHEVHSAAFLLLAETISGRWRQASDRAPRAEQACAENSDTPCQFNWRALLMAALAHAEVGNESEARRLEELAAESLTVQGPLAKEPSLLRLALHRADLGAVERMLAEKPEVDFFDVDYPAARLDALAALGDRRGVEAHASKALVIGGYVEPFALRALGAVRDDGSLMERSAVRFEEMGLGWRAAETRCLGLAD